MKTYNGKTITRKSIEDVIRTEDSTQIFRLYHRIYGGKVEKVKVCNFIKEFAPLKSLARNAVFLSNLAQADSPFLRDQSRKSFAWRQDNMKQVIMRCFREELRRGIDSYTKRPVMGHTYLYWCSPLYGHADYNKSRALPIAGNERFCELICRLADKYIPMNV